MAKENEKKLVDENIKNEALKETNEKLSTDDLDNVSGGLAITESQIRHMQHELGKDGKPGIKF